MEKPGAIIIEGHIQGLSNTRSLGQAGIPVFVVDKTKCIAQYSKYCEKFFISPDFIKDEFADFLINLALSEKISRWVLIPSNDHAVYILSKHKSRLEKYYSVITPNLKTIEKIYDKISLLKIAKRLSIPVPATFEIKPDTDKLPENIFFPLILKGRNGLSFFKTMGRKAFIAYQNDELNNYLNLIKSKHTLSNTYAQEVIPSNGQNKTISYTAFCENGKIIAHWAGIKIREHPLRFGTATFAKSIDIPECHIQSQVILKKLKYTGVCEIEYIQDPRTGTYNLIEINPRTWLWVGLANAAGIDYARMIYDYQTGNTVSYVESDPTTMYWRNPFTDFVFSFIAIFKGQLNILEYSTSLFKKKTVNALFLSGDNKPAFYYLWYLFMYAKNR